MTENLPLYSLVIRPPDDIIAIVRQMKDDLRSELGQWFNSSSSDAHITIKEFLNEEELNFHLPKIRAFCSAQAPEILRFNAFGNFGSHTFYIAPAPVSQRWLLHFLNDFKRQVTKPESLHPHISIARKLHRMTV